MSAASLLSSLKEKPTDESLKNGSNQSGEEEGRGEAGCGVGVGVGGSGDPAVLAVGPARKPLVYSRDTLLRLRHSPLVKQGLEHAFKGCDALALVLKKRPDSPNDEDRGAKGDAPNENHKVAKGSGNGGGGARERRAADPRERVRRESEGSGIVLSPQRRSFTSGCGAPAPAHAAHAHAAARPDSPHAAHAANHPNHPPPQVQLKTEQAGRRIGSGRIMVREAGAWDEGDFRDPYRPPRDRNPDRYERRSFNRDSFGDAKRDDGRERERERERFGGRDERDKPRGRYQHRRYEEEPEWFSAGPTSQLETIELRGFDEPARTAAATAANATTTTSTTTSTNTNTSNSNNKDPQKWSANANAKASGSGGEQSGADSSPDLAQGPANASTEEEARPERNEQPDQPDQPDFNLDEFLKFDSIPDVLTNGAAGGEGSRFSQWFRRASPDAPLHAMLQHVLDDSESARETPSGTQPMGFAPISPPHQPHQPLQPLQPLQPQQAHQQYQQHQPHQPHQPFSLLDLMFRNQKSRAEPVAGGKMQSLEELEARLRPHQAAPHHAVSDHDLSAFRRLLAQVSGGHAVAEQRPPPPPQPQPQPMSLLQMLSKSMEQQQQQQQQHQQQQLQQKAQQQHHQQQQQQPPPHIPQELLYKLLQVQQRQQQQQQQQHSLEPGLAGDRELLQRPEAQAIIHGLKAGEITVQHLMQQLGNPGLQSRHRELLLTILRLHQQHRQQQAGGSPLGSAGPPHLGLPPPQPPRLSPLPHPGEGGRIPSPRELAAHTASIMQGALIKKKLEEQRENFRRRHEPAKPHHSHPSHPPHPSHPTPISFTPTSVLRKMTADKEAEAGSPKQVPPPQWQQPHKLPQGRPIVKGNQSGAPSVGYNSPTEYQHLYMAQQQQQQQYNNIGSMGGMGSMGSMGSMGAMGNMSRGVSGGSTLQQLLMHSHHRTLNELGGGAAGCGDNQLARWFSPELLARASAGKLPSVHVPNALSLEDLERHHHAPPAHNAHAHAHAHAHPHPAQPVRN